MSETSEQLEELEGKSKMSHGPAYAIWKPSVKWLEPSEQSADIENPNSEQSARYSRYTKTSLRHDTSADHVHQLNESIRQASGSHNSIARPFARETSFISPPLHQEPVLFQAEPSTSGVRKVEVSSNSIIQSAASEKMSHKLVHNQYNSPIGMYSTEAIHKAIEAQSTELAPGLKGFKLPKHAVNKQSEVLKMIREEEEERKQTRATSSSSQASCSQGHSTPASTMRTNSSVSQQQSQRSDVQRAVLCNQSSAMSQSSAGHIARAVLKSVSDNKLSSQVVDSSRSSSGQPKCSECGTSIVGPFAKVEERFVHPHCFNCSTCGTSLKNSGYFSINEKLYCEIHARRVADVMRLNHNFQPDKQLIGKPTAQNEKVIATQVDRSSSSHASRSVGVINQPRVIDSQHGSTCCNQSTTISSIFSKQACNGCKCGVRSNITIFRPVQVEKQKELIRDNASSCTHSCTMGSSNATKQIEGFKSSAAFQVTGSAGSKLETRMPMCCNCHIQIHGPYILAGKTVWCKPCSENNFVCTTCHRSLLNVGFIEDNETRNKYHCERCFELHLMPVCAKCNTRIKELECLKALGKTWHTGCFVCAHCKCPFGNSKFYLEDNLPYCERDWNALFTTKCFSCNYPIEAGDRWIEALGQNYHSDCFRCTGCQVKLEGTTFLCKNGKPYCRMHAR